jgi:hypothetical protein
MQKSQHNMTVIMVCVSSHFQQLYPRLRTNLDVDEDDAELDGGSDRPEEDIDQQSDVSETDFLADGDDEDFDPEEDDGNDDPLGEDSGSEDGSDQGSDVGEGEGEDEGEGEGEGEDEGEGKTAGAVPKLAPLKKLTKLKGMTPEELEKFNAAVANRHVCIVATATTWRQCSWMSILIQGSDLHEQAAALHEAREGATHHVAIRCCQESLSERGRYSSLLSACMQPRHVSCVFVGLYCYRGAHAQAATPTRRKQEEVLRGRCVGHVLLASIILKLLSSHIGFVAV